MSAGSQDAGGCWAFLRGGWKRDGAGGGSQALSDDIREQIRSTIIKEMRAIEGTLTQEVETVSHRVSRNASNKEPLKVSTGFRRANSDSDGLSPRALGRPDLGALAAIPLQPLEKKRFGRRRTIGVDGSEDFTDILRNSTLQTVDDDDKENESGEDWCMGHTFSVVSLGSELRQKSLSPVKVRSRANSSGSEAYSVRVGRTISLDSSKMCMSNSSDEEEDALSFYSEERGKSGDDKSEKSVGGKSEKSSSSTTWRVDALDFGDRRAAVTAAKKGSASIESIIELVQTERERWNDEKQALEARLEELKAQQQQCSAVLPLDPEKEALKQQVHDLRQTMKLRSRFGAWVCERHMQESDDEEEEEVRNAEKEALRSEMQLLEAELKKARAEAVEAEAWDQAWFQAST